MAISPPNYQKDAIPTPQGWRHPRTNELLIARKISQGEIDEYLGVSVAPPPPPPPAPEPVEPIEVDEDDELTEYEFSNEETDFEDMTKIELEEVGREHGIELDRREKKTTLIEKLKSHIVG